jgi:Glycosyltransferase 61
MQGYVRTETYTPLLGLDSWLETRGDRDGFVRMAIEPAVRDAYETRFVDVREPALIERRSGYLFIRRGVYRESFNWWQFDDGPRPLALLAYAKWLVGRDRRRHFGEVVSLRTRWESNFWHCHDEVLSKLMLVDGAGLPPDVPLLVGRELWSQPFFQEMLKVRSLRDRNWVVHDADVTTDRAILCIQGPTHVENPSYVRDILRDPRRSPALRVSASTKVFVLRPRSLERHFLNEEELIAALTPLGFQALRTEEMPFWDQVSLFTSAECVVMAHGAALANLVHRIGSPSGLVEIFPNDPDYVRRVYGPWLCKAAGFSYRAIVGSAMVSSGFTVPPGELTMAVAEVLAELSPPDG